VFENRVLKKIFQPKRDEVTGEWRRLHNKELYAVYSPNTIQVIKSMRWARHVARIGEKRGAYTRFRRGDLREGAHLEGPGVDGRIILNGLD
jgi:hypothetical protein